MNQHGNDHNRRVNITPYARELKNGYKPKPMNHKTELYSLASVVIDGVAARVLAGRKLYPPFGLQSLDYADDRYKSVTSFDPDDPFSELEKNMRETLFHGLDEELESLEQRDEQENTVYTRLKRICNYAGQSGRRAIELFIRSGIATATDVMTGILGVIPEVHENENPDDEADPYLYDTTARNSFPLIATLSSSHINAVVPVLEILRKVPSLKGPFESRYFTLEQTHRGPRLAVKESAKDMARQQLGYWLNNYVGDSPTLRCPAGVDFSDSHGTFVERLWNWHLEIAPFVYNWLSETVPSHD